MPLMLTILTVVVGLAFFITAFRAMRFAQRHKDRLETVTDKTTWWMRLFMKNGYGADAEEERRRLALQVLIPFALFFALAGAAQLMVMPH